jgi:hypothetical protein
VGESARLNSGTSKSIPVDSALASISLKVGSNHFLTTIHPIAKNPPLRLPDRRHSIEV